MEITENGGGFKFAVKTGLLQNNTKHFGESERKMGTREQPTLSPPNLSPASLSLASLSPSHFVAGQFVAII